MNLKGRSLIVISACIFIIFIIISNLFFAAVAGISFYYLPVYLKWHKEKAYRGIFCEQLIDGIEMIAGALKAGMTFQQALVHVIKETKPPISIELKGIMDKIMLGVGTEKALFELAEKHKLEELYLFASAFNITRAAGGNLAEVLRNVASGMREKIRLEKQIEVLTAQGKLSGIIVGILPVVLLTLMYIMDKDLILPLFRSLPGLALLFVALALELTGFFFIRRIIKIDY